MAVAEQDKLQDQLGETGTVRARGIPTAILWSGASTANLLWGQRVQWAVDGVAESTFAIGTRNCSPRAVDSRKADRCEHPQGKRPVIPS